MLVEGMPPFEGACGDFIWVALRNSLTVVRRPSKNVLLPGRHRIREAVSQT
jgi:hypothetical protein